MEGMEQELRLFRVLHAPPPRPRGRLTKKITTVTASFYEGGIGRGAGHPVVFYMGDPARRKTWREVARFKRDDLVLEITGTPAFQEPKVVGFIEL